MSAKDWAPLRNALWHHVREPLQRDHPKEWDGVRPGDAPPFHRLTFLANGGKVSATDSRSVVLWYTLVYGCPHFDALCALMAKGQFEEPALRALTRPTTHTPRIFADTLLNRYRNKCTPSPRLLHVDFGCGPGTASWAIVKILASHATLMTIGHDHNRRMTRLAKTITCELSNTGQGIRYKFFSNWTLFRATVRWLAARNYDLILVTVNSLFGQHAVGDDDIKRIMSLIATLRDRSGESAMFVIGTHPRFEPDRVAAAWQRIADMPGRDMRYNGDVYFNSWNPVCSGNCEPGDDNAWSRWRGQPQLGHIVEVNG